MINFHFLIQNPLPASTQSEATPIIIAPQNVRSFDSSSVQIYIQRNETLRAEIAENKNLFKNMGHKFKN